MCQSSDVYIEPYVLDEFLKGNSKTHDCFYNSGGNFCDFNFTITYIFEGLYFWYNVLSSLPLIPFADRL